MLILSSGRRAINYGCLYRVKDSLKTIDCQSTEELQAIVRQKIADNAWAFERALADIDFADLGVVSMRDFRDVLSLQGINLSDEQVRIAMFTHFSFLNCLREICSTYLIIFYYMRMAVLTVHENNFACKPVNVVCSPPSSH
jgi:hypothetical protein